MIIALFSLLIFLAVLLLVGGILVHRQGATVRALDRRLRGLGAKEPGGAARLEIERDERYSRMHWLDALIRVFKLGEHLEMLLYQSGLNIRPGVLVLLIALCCMVAYVAGLALFHSLPISLLSMALLGPVPYYFVAHKKGQRMKAFAKEFPDSLDLLVSALRAGLSFAAAMQIVAEESPEPIRSEFAVTVEEQALGLDFREALVNLTKRVDSLDLRFFVTAVVLQRDTGGNLAEILENTARLIRERFKVMGDIMTFTAHGRMTGMVLMFLPLVMAMYTWAVSPDYFRPMFETYNGRFLLISAGAMQLLGMFVIRKIVNIRV
jgi:tight adherence protein B